MKALEILAELLKHKYKNQPLFFGVQKSIEDIENIHDAIEELEAFQNRSCESCEILGCCEIVGTKNIKTFYCANFIGDKNEF